jgi:hypothetical protein
MTTFKDLQNRTEEAERIAEEATAQAASVKLEANSRVSAVEAELASIKAKAETYILEARSRISSANLEVRQAQVAAITAQQAAQPFGYERDEWWQKVFLTTLSTLTDPSVAVRVKVAHAAGVATEALRVRAALLTTEGMLLTVPEPEAAVEAQEPAKAASKKAKKSNGPREAPEVPLANWMNGED